MRQASPYPSGPCPPGAEGLRHDPKRNARRNGLRPAMTPETTPTKPGGEPNDACNTRAGKLTGDEGHTATDAITGRSL